MLPFTFTALMVAAVLRQDSLSFRVEAPATAHAGEAVPIVLRLTNRTGRPVTLTLQGRPLAYDVTVTAETGALVWRRLEGQVVSAILAVRTLAPGASLTFEAVWDGQDHGRPAHPGRYLVGGRLPTDTPSGLVAQPAELRVLAVHQE
jgi:hypothetical protein